jgi:molybdopterin converting factor small subunit
MPSTQELLTIGISFEILLSQVLQLSDKVAFLPAVTGL